MVFSSLVFIFRFMPVFFLIYFLVPNRWRNGVLLAGSLFFYAYGELLYTILLVLSILVNHGAAQAIGRPEQHMPKRRKTILLLALVFNFGLLFYFKYINFFLGNINHLLPAAWQLPAVAVTLPLGISFYTFQIVSYVVDVYRGTTMPSGSLLTTGTYLCMFPQLVAGPIVIYSDVEQALKKRSCTRADLEQGIQLFIVGLGFKVLLANRLSTLWSGLQTVGYENLSTPLAWLGAFGYSLQLYFDFNGYSLMAIGLGRMMGFHLPRNFDLPYLSKSVTEFWRRWHITLGTWFREYVYIPLGGNRRGQARTVFNLLVVWSLTGLWHGASWNFVLWGLTLFVLMLIERLALKRFLDGSRVLSHLYLLFVIPQTWVLFAITDLKDVGLYFSRLFPFFGSVGVNVPGLFLKNLGLYWPFLLAGVFFCLPFFRRWYERYREGALCRILLFGVFWFAVYELALGANNPFLYFRF